MSITHAGKVTARAGEHVLRHVAPLMPHEFIQMQTIAANLGSMLTLIGNPQNLYLYGKSGMSIGGFVLLMLPYTLVSLLLLLSGFTAETQALIIGTNLGGLGTLIASMASLISYRQIARELPQGKKQYFGLFTLSNLIFLAILLGVWFLLR